MVIVEKTENSDIYIFHSGTEDEKRLEWKLEDDDLPRQNPPFMLEGDILSYVKEIESILSVTKGENLDIVEKRYRGLNNVLTRVVEENEGYVWDVEVLCSESGDCVRYECGRMLGEGGIDSSCKSLETVLPPIKNLVDCEWGYVMVYGEVFHVRDWWLQEGKYGLFPGVVVLYELWMYLNIKVEEMYHLFEKIGHQVENITPAYLTYRMMERAKNGEAILKSELNHPIYTVTGIRYHMGDNLTSDEMTTAAERFLAGLKKGKKVVLVAEPDNPYDSKAIAAYIDYRQIGYIARENTDEVATLLDNNGQCEAVVERGDGHITLYISIPGAPNETVAEAVRPRLLPESPLGEGVRMPYADDEKTLQLVATRLIKTEVSEKNLNEIIRLADLYVPLRKLSICHDDTLWRDKISKMLYRILYGSSLPLPLKEEKRKMVEILYELVYRAIGDMRSTKEHWPEQVFIEHLDRLRNNSSTNQHLYKKYCDEFFDGIDFTEADKVLVAKEYERLCGWFKKMKWRELRNPDDLQRMGLKVNNLGLSRQELYDLYGVLLIIEKLKEVIATPDNKIGATSYISQNKYDSLSDSRKAIFNELFALAGKGDLVEGITAEDIKVMLSTILGLGEGVLTKEQVVLSGKLWLLLEGGRKGENGRVRIIWQNMVGFLDERRLFKQKGASALNKDFFGDSKGYTNIDKGRPKRADMSKGFREILSLLEAYAPKLPKKE